MADFLDNEAASTRPPLANGEPAPADALQSLDDLTVLSQISEQRMAAAGLNVLRPADLGGTGLGNLALVHQGSTGNPQPAPGHGFVGGSAGVGVDSASGGHASSASISEIPSQTAVFVEEAKTIVGLPPSVLDVSAPPSAEVPADAHVPSAGLPLPIFAAPPIPATAPGHAGPPAVAPPPAATTSAPSTETPPAHENQPPAMAAESSAATDEKHAVDGRVSASDPEGDPVSYHLAGAGVVHNADGTETRATAFGSVTLDTATGSYEFVPSTGGHLGVGESLADSFGVFATDSHGASGNVETVDLAISGTNDNPIVSAPSLATQDDHTAVSGAASASDADTGVVGSSVAGPADVVSYALLAADGRVSTSLDTAHGHVSIDPATGEYTFVPVGVSALGVGQTAMDGFDVVAIDNHGLTGDPAHVGVAIVGSNDAPILSVSDNSGHGTIRGAVSAFDADAGDTPAYSLVGAGSDGVLHLPHGDVAIDAGGNYTFVPAADWRDGEQTAFSVQVADGHGGIDTKSIVLTEIDAHAPAIVGGVLAEGHGAASGRVLSIDADGDAATASLVLGQGPSHGVVAVGADGTFTYTDSNASWQAGATDTFSVKVDDGHGGATTQTVTVTDTDANAPTLAGDTARSGHGTIVGNIAAGDLDGDAVKVSLVGAGDDGTLVVNDVNGHAAGSVGLAADGCSYAFTPASGWQGGEQVAFQVQADDGHGGTTTKAIVLTETDAAPTASTQTFGGTESTSGAATVVTGRIVATDADHDDLSYSAVAGQGPAHGAVGVNADGTFAYAATDNNWSGSDAFTVKVSDGHGGTVNETVNVNVGGAADQATVGISIGAGTVTPNGGFTVQNLDGEAGYSNTYGYYVTDADGNPASGRILFANTHAEDDVVKTITGVDPDHVGFFIVPNGHSDNPNLTDGAAVVFTHDNSGWHAVANGQMLVGDGTGVLFDKGSLNADGLAHTRDASIDAGNQNWEDLNGGGDRDFNDVNATVAWLPAAPTETHPLTVSAVFPDMDGSEKHAVILSNLPPGSTLYQDGVAMTAVNGAYSLDPARLTGLSVKTPAGFAGDLNVTVTAVSSENGTTATATSTAAVHDDLSNHGPIADAGHAYGDTIDTVLTGAVVATDANGDHLRYALGSGTSDGAQHGSVVLGIDGGFTYTPTTGFTGMDRFNVVVSDGHGGTATETLAIDVSSPNHAPAIDAGRTTAILSLSDAHSANVGQVAATDADGDRLTYSVLSDGSTHHGSLAIDSASGSFFYDSTDTNWKGGADTFTVKVEDGHGGSVSQSVVVNVTGAGNDVGYSNVGHSGGGSAQAIGWGDGGGRSESWGPNGSWAVGGENNGSDHRVVTTSIDSHWGGGWYAWDSGNPGQAGTGDMVTIAGYNQHQHAVDGNSRDTLLGASGNDYISLDDGYGNQMMKGIGHVQLGDGNAILDMTTPNLNYGDMTVAGGSGSDVIWTAGGNDLVVAGNGATTIHAGAGDDTVVAGAGNDTLLGQDGNDTFLFDFGHGHALVDGGAGANWTDTLDLATDMRAGATITITTTDNHSWTEASDGDHQAHGTIALGQDKAGDVVIHSAQGDETVHFTNIEHVKF